MIQIFWKLVTKQTSYFLVQVCKGQKKIPQKNFSILLSGTKLRLVVEKKRVRTPPNIIASWLSNMSYHIDHIYIY